MKRKLRDISFYLLTLLFCSCVSRKSTNTMPGQLRPEYYSSSKGNRNLVDSILDTSAIYVYETPLVRTYRNGRIERFYGYTYLVFKSNGLAFYSAYAEQPFTQTNIYSIDGQYCFYKVEGDELQLEYFDYHLKKFAIAYGKVYADKVHIYKDRLRIFWGGKSKRNMPFKKWPIKYTRPLVWPE
jgi:hypothetical protein